MGQGDKALEAYCIADFTDELASIAGWWLHRAPDLEFDGFFGEIDVEGRAIEGAHKGIILNARILWFFSEASCFLKSEPCCDMAHRAYHYLVDYFDDQEFGGVYWLLDHRGGLIDDIKKTYAQSFTIYGLCSYYRLTGDKGALDRALAYFELIEKYCHDDFNGGYREAFSRSWQPVEDVRLSEKDANQPKSMNTHLHVLEAYTALYAVHPTAGCNLALRRLIGYFNDYIIDLDNFHLRLFMNDEWLDRSSAISYGHDIEASWLIWEALEVLGDVQLKRALKPVILKMAEACLTEGLADRGNLCDELSFEKGEREEGSCWWIQAEALVGFINAYALTENPVFLAAFSRIWEFIKNYHIDPEKGEWHWQSTLDNRQADRNYKAGFWKAPYHNGRSMMEVVRRLNHLKLLSVESENRRIMSL